METQIKQTVFNRLMINLGIHPAPTEREGFDDWMRYRVKSIHYANNEKMTNAYQRIT
jgi:hypothetical protein